jgi:predicted protein tyrosine phosphatase
MNIYPNHASIYTDRLIAIVGINEIKDIEVEDKDNSVLISITEPGSKFIDDSIKQNYYDTLEVQFWDITKSHDNYKIISDEIAKKIRRFILNNRECRFAVHCSAGISRSAGVASAIECLLDFDGDVYAYQLHGSDIRRYWRYHPNHTVFLKVVGGNDMDVPPFPVYEFDESDKNVDQYLKLIL